MEKATRHSGLHAARVDSVYQQHYLELVRLAVQFVDDVASAEDVVQDVFARIARGPLVPADDARNYLRAAVLNGCRSTLRRRRVVLDARDRLPRRRAAGITEDTLSHSSRRTQRSFVLALAATLVATVILILCGSFLLLAPSAPTNSPSASLQPGSLTGVHWTLVEVQTEGLPAEVAPDDSIWIEFTALAYVLYDGCNRMSGDYKQSATVLTSSLG